MTYSGFGHSRRTRIRLLVTVKAYPTLSERHGEAVCVAGIRTDIEPHRWVRLFPVSWYDLLPSQQFDKWEFIELDIQRGSDSRPESYQPIAESIVRGRKVGTSNGWSERRWFLEPLVAPSMCEVRRRRAVDNTSLAVIRPRSIRDFVKTPARRLTPGQRGIANQLRLSDEPEPKRSRESLEELPYDFRYRYHCADPDCSGHKQKVLDWEIGQAYRRWRHRYPDDETVTNMIREKWFGELAGPDKDTHFFVGNAHQYPDAFMVLGVFWPPAEVQGRLF